ncbi:MAG TPA: hypothetical protein VGP80_10825 [Gemmatimonadales bacterium]|nr:hypothetical protein [Gemmatimonadales bacterium]
MPRCPVRLWPATLFLLISACSSDSTAPETIHGAKQILSGLQFTALSPGHQLTIQPGIYDSAGELIPYHSPTVFTWTSSAPAQATVSDRGVVKVLGSATLGTFFTIRVCVGSVCDLPSFVVAAQPDSVTLVTQGKQVVVGGRSSLTGVGWIGGAPRPSYFFTFGVTDSSVLRVQRHGCGEGPTCVINSPDVTESYPLSAGTVTVTAASQGLGATGTMTVRTVLFNPTTLTAGGSHTCAYATDGVPFCWGEGYATTPIGPSGLPQLQQLRAGTGQTCGIDGGGLVQCWANGYNPVAAPLSTSIHFSRLAVGSRSSCGIDINGGTWCWGANDWGQLGDGTKNPSSVPVPVSGNLPFVQLAVYGNHACGRTGAGEAWCWGSNFNGELGSPGVTMACGVYDCALAPQLVSGNHIFGSLVAGSFHTCGIDTNGAAWCWGALDKLGNGFVAPPNPTDPVAVSGSHVWTQLTAGSIHTCGITDLGQSFCWGGNPDGRSGQIPDGSTLVVPTLITGGHTFSELHAGGAHTCGYASDGVYCFGDNGFGQVGGTVVNTQSPVKVAGQP